MSDETQGLTVRERMQRLESLVERQAVALERLLEPAPERNPVATVPQSETGLVQVLIQSLVGQQADTIKELRADLRRAQQAQEIHRNPVEESISLLQGLKGLDGPVDRLIDRVLPTVEPLIKLHLAQQMGPAKNPAAPAGKLLDCPACSGKPVVQGSRLCDACYDTLAVDTTDAEPAEQPDGLSLTVVADDG